MLAGYEDIWYLIPVQEEGILLLFTKIAVGCHFSSHTQGQRKPGHMTLAYKPKLNRASFPW